MNVTTVLARWAIILKRSAWLQYIPRDARNLVVAGMRCFLWLATVVEVVFLLFRLTCSHGLRVCFEAVKLAFSLLQMDVEEEEKSGGQSTRGGFREAIFVQRNFHSAINRLHAASFTFTSTSRLTSRDDAYTRLKEFADQPGRTLRADIDQTHLLLLSLARSWHDTTSLPLQHVIHVRPDLFYRVGLALESDRQNVPGEKETLRTSFLTAGLPLLRETVDGRIEAIANNSLHHTRLYWAASELLFHLARTFHPYSHMSERIVAAFQHCVAQARPGPYATEYYAKEAAYRLTLEESPVPLDPPPYEPYLRFLIQVDSVASGLSPARLTYEEVKSLLEPYLQCTDAEVEATKAEEKLFVAVLDAVLAREEVKRMSRRKKLEAGRN